MPPETKDLHFRVITCHTALRLAHFFGTSPEFCAMLLVTNITTLFFLSLV